MDARSAFKFAFISHCIDLGHTTPESMLGALKSAIDRRATKQADFGLGALGLGLGEAVKGLGEVGGKVLEFGLPIAAVAPAAAGVLGGTLAAKATDTSDYDVDQAKNQEVVDEYRRQADRLRREGALRRISQAPARSYSGPRF